MTAAGAQIRLVLLDDHPVVLTGLQTFFATEPSLTVVAACTTGEQALDAIRTRGADVLVLDLKMPEPGGLALLRTMAATGVSVRVVLLTAEITEEQTIEAIRLGVLGIVLKENGPRVLVDCIRKVHAGEQWLPRKSLADALDRARRRETALRDLSAVLTRRELEIVRMTASGLHNAEIAARLSVSEGTVKTHLHHIYDKLGVENRLKLMVRVREEGLA